MTLSVESISFRQRMEALRTRPALTSSVPTGDWTVVDLMRHDRILGATVWAKPDEEYPGADRPHGQVVYCDDEGVKAIECYQRFGRPWARTHNIAHEDIDDRQTVPGDILARHRLARRLVAVVAGGKGQVNEFDRRLLAFASYLSAQGTDA